jgi:hypothetical protein
MLCRTVRLLVERDLRDVDLAAGPHHALILWAYIVTWSGCSCWSMPKNGYSGQYHSKTGSCLFSETFSVAKNTFVE